MRASKRRVCATHPESGLFVFALDADDIVCLRCQQGRPADGTTPAHPPPEETELRDGDARDLRDHQGRRIYGQAPR